MTFLFSVIMYSLEEYDIIIEKNVVVLKDNYSVEVGDSNIT